MAGAPSLPQRLGGMGLVLHHTGHSTTRKAFGRAYRIIRRIYIYINIYFYIYIYLFLYIYIYRCVAHSSKRTASSTRISLGQPPTVRCSLSATFRHSFDKLAWSYSTVKPTANFDHIQVLNTKWSYQMDGSYRRISHCLFCERSPQQLPWECHLQLWYPFDHDPSMIRTWTRHLAPACSPMLLVAVRRRILYWKLPAFRAPAIYSNFTKCCACHEKWHCNITKCCACHQNWHCMTLRHHQIQCLPHHEMLLRLPR